MSDEDIVRRAQEIQEQHALQNKDAFDKATRRK